MQKLQGMTNSVLLGQDKLRWALHQQHWLCLGHNVGFTFSVGETTPWFTISIEQDN